MFGIGQTELLIFLIIVLVLFGGSRIPSIARSLGKSITEFKKGVQGIEEETPPPQETPKNPS
jgi:sec-independent protein translocase protein TatA